MTKMVTVSVANIRSYEYASEQPLSDFLKWLGDLIENVPLQYQSAIRIEFDTYPDYGSDSTDLRLSYLRPETDLERDDRIADEQANREIQIANKRRQFKQLKAELGE